MSENSSAKVIPLTEHEDSVELFDDALIKKAIDFVGPPEKFMVSPVMLGLKAKRGETKDSIILQSHFYIGATWIIQNKIAAVVLPKIENIDYIKMFSYALQVKGNKEREYFSKCYGIDFDAPEIEVDSKLNIISPIIMCHFISLLEEIVIHGLKKGYVINESNLKAKVKGHILFARHLTNNIIPKREDRNYCRFAEYTTDIPENRLLKKALLFVQSAIRHYTDFYNQGDKNNLPFSIRINKLLNHFNNVSGQASLSDVQKTSSNKLFSSYSEAIRLAKMILRHHDNEIARSNNKTEKHKVPPFWIDMPRLYEMYVYGKLLEMTKEYDSLKNEKIIFQCEGYQGTAADFVFARNGIILDAKYKPQYDEGNRGLIQDVREMSGYARDKKILSRMDNKHKEPIKAVILYPRNMMEEYDDIFNKSGDVEEINKTNQEVDFLTCNAKKITSYKEFYKMPIDIPLKKG